MGRGAGNFRGPPPPRLGADDLELWRRVARSARPLEAKGQLFTPRLQDDAAPEKPVSLPDMAPNRVAAPRVRQVTIGAAAPSPRHDLARPLSEVLGAAPALMDKRKFQAMTRGKLAPEARLDLHGMTLSQAHNVLTGFIRRTHAEGKRLVLVITGKGKGGVNSRDDHGPIPQRPGALKHQLPIWLRTPPLAPLILELREAHATHGGSGAYYVYLRRAR